MSRGDSIAEYLRQHHDPTQHLIWANKLQNERVNWSRFRYRRVAKYSDGTACVVSQDERGYFVYGPYFTWRAHSASRESWRIGR